MRIWIVSMECAGISEAGGVKDVTFSLCENLSKRGNDVTLFIPYFGCTSLENLRDFKSGVAQSNVSLCAQQIDVTYSTARFSGSNVNVVFVNHLAFLEKKAVYVYTKEEECENPRHQCGKGHEDFHFLDSLLCASVASYGGRKEIFSPDIVHCQDASTAMTPAFIELLRPDLFRDTKSVVTIHNAGAAYHHDFYNIDEAFHYTGLPWNWLENSLNEGRVEPFLIAAQFSHLTTVSTFYAEEITNPSYSASTDGLSKIFSLKNIKVEGITNGIEYSMYEPENTESSLLPYAMNPCEKDFKGKFANRKFFLELCEKADDFSLFARSLPENQKKYLENFVRHGYLSNPANGKDCVFFTYHGRLVWQKGLHVLSDAMDVILNEMENVWVSVVGQGDPQIENRIKELSLRYPGKIVYFKGYNPSLSRLCVAQADFAVFPSDFEPCCLEDLVAQVFGTIPIANATGGLKKIIDGETGFLYSPNKPEELCEAIRRASNLKFKEPETFCDMAVWTANYVKIFNSWKHVTDKYLNLFRKIIQGH